MTGNRLVKLTLILILLSAQTAHSQYVSATINDADGYTNVRADSTSGSDVIDKFYNGEVFEYNADDWFEGKKWVHVSMNRSADRNKCKYDGIGGYMHRSRIQPLDKLPDNFERKQTENAVELTNGDLKARIETRTLTDSENKALYNDGCIWGTDTGNPKNVITNVQITMQGSRLTLPQESFNDLYRASLDQSYLKAFNDFVFIVMSNSDAAGFYEVTWTFKEGKFVRRYINLGP